MRRGINQLCYVLLLSSLFFAELTLAQINNFRQWSVKDGLPQSNVYCMIQDRRGYIWIGTGGGVSIFDGKNFKTFTKRDGLYENAVRSIFEDSKGQIWLGTNEGITLYDGYKFKTISKKNGLSGSTILCFIEDAQQNIWAGSDDGGINKIKQIRKDSFSIKVINERQGLSSSSVFDLYQDAHQNIWAATFGGINVIQQHADSITVQVINGKENIPSDKLLSIAKDAQGDLWFGTYDGGAFKISVDNLNLKIKHIPVTVYNTFNGLNSNSIWKVLCTKSKNTWFANTLQGLNRFVPDKQGKGFSIHSYAAEQGLTSNGILCLLEDAEGNVWIGSNGDGLFMTTGDYFSHYNEKTGLSNVLVQSIKQDSSGEFWIATAGGAYKMTLNALGTPLFKPFEAKKGLTGVSVSCIATGNTFNRNTWIGTIGKGILRYNGRDLVNFTEENALVDNRINSLMVDSKGIVWCGTANGLSRFDGVKFMSIPTDRMQMDAEGVKSIIEDKKGNIWFGTAGGLARYSGGGILRTFDEKEGLNTKDVNTLAEGYDGTIWIGTNGGGIYAFDTNQSDTTSIHQVVTDSMLTSGSIHSLVFQDKFTLIAGTFKGFSKVTLNEQRKIVATKFYDLSDGFIGIECNDNAIYKDREGNIWFGTIKGLTRYSPQLELKKTTRPKVHITALQLFNKTIDWSTKADSVKPWFGLPHRLVLPYNQNNLTFQFTGISLKNPEKLTFKYLLLGRDNEWSPPKKISEVNFSGLSHGNYIFEIMVKDADGIWSDPEVFVFTIAPAWYQTIWFYCAVIAIIVIFIYTYIRFRERKLQKEKKILEDTVEDRTREVVQQKEHIAEKNREITDSINYAKRIQNAILPNVTRITKVLPQSFVLFKPKDIVSGDFYWLYVVKEPSADLFESQATYLMAAADCTGHGVPGAFMSTIGVEKLNESAKKSTLPGELLSHLNRAIKSSLHQTEESDINESASRDGMDIALVRITRYVTYAELDYAAANRPLWIFRKGSHEVEELKATKVAIGGLTQDDQVFENHRLRLEVGDTLYIFSDGFADQFSPEGKKLMTRQFKRLLGEIQSKSMLEQQVYLNTYIDQWKGNVEQTDDILVIGIRIEP